MGQKKTKKRQRKKKTEKDKEKKDRKRQSNKNTAKTTTKRKKVLFIVHQDLAAAAAAAAAAAPLFADTAKDSRLSWPSLFCGKRLLKPMVLRAVSNVWSEMVCFSVETNQLTPSEQGGVVRDPLYLGRAVSITEQAHREGGEAKSDVRLQGAGIDAGHESRHDEGPDGGLCARRGDVADRGKDGVDEAGAARRRAQVGAARVGAAALSSCCCCIVVFRGLVHDGRPARQPEGAEEGVNDRLGRSAAGRRGSVGGSGGSGGSSAVAVAACRWGRALRPGIPGVATLGRASRASRGSRGSRCHVGRPVGRIEIDAKDGNFVGGRLKNHVHFH